MICTKNRLLSFKNRLLLVVIASTIIAIGMIVSTLIYVSYNRYEYHEKKVGSIVFDKRTGRQYNPMTRSGEP